MNQKSMSLIWFDWIEPNREKLHVIFFLVNDFFVDSLNLFVFVFQM